MKDAFEINRKKVLLRQPKSSDAEKLQKFVNQGIEESLKAGGLLGRTKKLSLVQEKKWLKNLLEDLKKKNKVYIIAEYGNRVIGTTEIRRGSHDSDQHVGIFGIVILQEFTSKGLGTLLTKRIIEEAKKKMKIEIVKLSVDQYNKRAQGLYKKVGFEEVGRIKNGRKINGKYTDEIMMVKYL